MQKPVTSEWAARLFASPEAALALARAAWPRVVGDDLAHRTEVLSLHKGTLHVRVPDARWRKALHRMRGEILSRLRDIAGPAAPRGLGFTERSGPPPEETRQPTRQPPGLAPLDPAVLEAAERIEDPALRARFLECAARYLARRSDTR